MTSGTRVHLVDGTWELFRHHFGMPSGVRARDGAAVRAVARSMAGLLESGVTHLGIATDHVVESFRNALWPGYKTGAGIDPHLLAQFGAFEDALDACGIVVWPMVEFEADDALASAAARASADPDVVQVIICSPDKDLAQCVEGTRVVQLDRRTDQIRDADGVREHFGVAPPQIPDWLALVGDSADGFPGLSGWGARSAAAVLDAYGSLDAIPDDPGTWTVSVRGAARLASVLKADRALAERFRTLARLRRDVDVLPTGVDALRWSGPTDRITAVAETLGASELPERLFRLANARAG
jgi:5'-3' exonuclease